MKKKKKVKRRKKVKVKVGEKVLLRLALKGPRKTKALSLRKKPLKEGQDPKVRKAKKLESPRNPRSKLLLLLLFIM